MTKMGEEYQQQYFFICSFQIKIDMMLIRHISFTSSLHVSARFSISNSISLLVKTKIISKIFVQVQDFSFSSINYLHLKLMKIKLKSRVFKKYIVKRFPFDLPLSGKKLFQEKGRQKVCRHVHQNDKAKTQLCRYINVRLYSQIDTMQNIHHNICII